MSKLHQVVVHLSVLILCVLVASCASRKNADDVRQNQGGTGRAHDSTVPPPDPAQAQVPEGYRVEVVMKNLTYPSSVEFDANGNLYVAEAGYSYGDERAQPRLLRVSRTGEVEVVTTDLSGPVNDLLWHDGRLYVSHRGKLSVLEGRKVRDLVTGLPSDGDHHNNQLTAGPDGKLYFGQGTATNSGVVGMDNFKMGWLKEHRDFHDIAPKPIPVRDRAYTTENPFKQGSQQAKTSAFQPFGKTLAAGSTVNAQTKASGTVLRMNPDGSGLEVHAWGLRNPYGLMWGPDGKLYATENGFDVRGSRPIANDKEDLYEIKEGAWYGWPDYGSGIPVTDPQFKPEGKPQPEFLMLEHPPVEKPLLSFPKHAAITKIDFSPSDAFGKGRMFVAFFGHMTPITGQSPKEHGGHRVVRIDLATKKVETFFTKKGHGGGHGGESSGGHGHGSGGHAQQQGQSGGGGHGHGGKDESITAGPRRLVDVKFSPSGDALYVVDFGSMTIEQKPNPIHGTGVLWRIVPNATSATQPPVNLSAPSSGGHAH